MWRCIWIYRYMRNIPKGTILESPGIGMIRGYGWFGPEGRACVQKNQGVWRRTLFEGMQGKRSLITSVVHMNYVANPNLGSTLGSNRESLELSRAALFVGNLVKEASGRALKPHRAQHPLPPKYTNIRPLRAPGILNSWYLGTLWRPRLLGFLLGSLAFRCGLRIQTLLVGLFKTALPQPQNQLHSPKTNMESETEPFKEHSSPWRTPFQIPCWFGRVQTLQYGISLTHGCKNSTNAGRLFDASQQQASGPRSNSTRSTW